MAEGQVFFRWGVLSPSAAAGAGAGAVAMRGCLPIGRKPSAAAAQASTDQWNRVYLVLERRSTAGEAVLLIRRSGTTVALLCPAIPLGSGAALMVKSETEAVSRYFEIIPATALADSKTFCFYAESDADYLKWIQAVSSVLTPIKQPAKPPTPPPTPVSESKADGPAPSPAKPAPAMSTSGTQTADPTSVRTGCLVVTPVRGRNLPLPSSATSSPRARRFSFMPGRSKPSSPRGGGGGSLKPGQITLRMQLVDAVGKAYAASTTTKGVAGPSPLWEGSSAEQVQLKYTQFSIDGDVQLLVEVIVEGRTMPTASATYNVSNLIRTDVLDLEEITLEVVSSMAKSPTSPAATPSSSASPVSASASASSPSLPSILVLRLSGTSTLCLPKDLRDVVAKVAAPLSPRSGPDSPGTPRTPRSLGAGSGAGAGAGAGGRHSMGVGTTDPLSPSSSSILFSSTSPRGAILGSLSPKSGPQPFSGSFQLTLREGVDLVNMDRFSKQDPYVVAKLIRDDRPDDILSEARSSTIFKGGTDPKWADELLVLGFRSALRGDPLRIRLECWDQDKIGSDDFVGSGMMDVGRYIGPASSPATDVEVSLSLPDKPDAFRGILKLTLATLSTPLIPPPTAPVRQRLRLPTTPRSPLPPANLRSGTLRVQLLRGSGLPMMAVGGADKRLTLRPFVSLTLLDRNGTRRVSTRSPPAPVSGPDPAWHDCELTLQYERLFVDDDVKLKAEVWFTGLDTCSGVGEYTVGKLLSMTDPPDLRIQLPMTHPSPLRSAAQAAAAQATAEPGHMTLYLVVTSDQATPVQPSTPSSVRSRRLPSPTPATVEPSETKADDEGSSRQLQRDVPPPLLPKPKSPPRPAAVPTPAVGTISITILRGESWKGLQYQDPLVKRGPFVRMHLQGLNDSRAATLPVTRGGWNPEFQDRHSPHHSLPYVAYPNVASSLHLFVEACYMEGPVLKHVGRGVLTLSRWVGRRIFPKVLRCKLVDQDGKDAGLVMCRASATYERSLPSYKRTPEIEGAATRIQRAFRRWTVARVAARMTGTPSSGVGVGVGVGAGAGAGAGAGGGAGATATITPVAPTPGSASADRPAHIRTKSSQALRAHLVKTSAATPGGGGGGGGGGGDASLGSPSPKKLTVGKAPSFMEKAASQPPMSFLTLVRLQRMVRRFLTSLRARKDARNLLRARQEKLRNRNQARLRQTFGKSAARKSRSEPGGRLGPDDDASESKAREPEIIVAEMEDLDLDDGRKDASGSVDSPVDSEDEFPEFTDDDDSDDDDIHRVFEGRVTVTVIRGFDLRTPRTYGKSDPFVRLTLKSDVRRRAETLAVKQGGPDAAWSTEHEPTHVLEYNMTAASLVLRVALWDYEIRNKSKMLAVGTVDLTRWKGRRSHPREFKCQLFNGKGASSGMLLLRISTAIHADAMAARSKLNRPSQQASKVTDPLSESWKAVTDRDPDERFAMPPKRVTVTLPAHLRVTLFASGAPESPDDTDIVLVLSQVVQGGFVALYPRVAYIKSLGGLAPRTLCVGDILTHADDAPACVTAPTGATAVTPLPKVRRAVESERRREWTLQRGDEVASRSNATSGSAPPPPPRRPKTPPIPGTDQSTTSPGLVTLDAGVVVRTSPDSPMGTPRTTWPWMTPSSTGSGLPRPRVLAHHDSDTEDESSEEEEEEEEDNVDDGTGVVAGGRVTPQPPPPSPPASPFSQPHI